MNLPEGAATARPWDRKLVPIYAVLQRFPWKGSHLMRDTGAVDRIAAALAAGTRVWVAGAWYGLNSRSLCP
jgi:hypothetical protein